MKSDFNFEVIVIGGSYSGLAAAMSLGRAMRKVLVIDNGQPCNRHTPFSHNFLTNDGKTPAEIATLAKSQVSVYDSITLVNGTVGNVHESNIGFNVIAVSGEVFTAKKIIFATGIKDILPDIDGVQACWGVSILHCPYCHGYEVRDQKTGILGNGNSAFDLVRLISNWTQNLTLYTNGSSTLTFWQEEELNRHNIKIVEKQIQKFDHSQGYLRKISFKDDTESYVDVVYAPSPFQQNSNIPQLMGCELTDEGYIKVDYLYETTVKGVFAIGDAVSKMRTVANAVSTGTAAGITVSKKLILENF